jgi:hypothetical protein
VVKFPSMKMDELASMVDLYARGQLPYPRDQAVTDFHLLAQQDGFTTVGIVACQRETVDKFLGVLRDAGLSPVGMTVSSCGVLGWYRQTLVLEPSREPALVINVDDARTDFVVVADGRLLTSRSIGQGFHDWGTTVDSTELLALEAGRTHAAVKKELPDADVRSLVVTGVGQLAQWGQMVGTRLGLPAEAVEPPAADRKSSAVEFSAAVTAGLATTPMTELLNLGPPELRAHVQHRQQVRQMAWLSVLLVAVLSLGAGVLALQGIREERHSAQVDGVLVELEPQAKRVRTKLRLTEVTEGVLDHRRQLATLLSGLLDATPSAVTLEGLAFERGRAQVELRGSGSSTQSILDYIQTLEQLEEVEAVELKRSGRRSGPSGDRADFELLLRVRPSKGSG